MEDRGARGHGSRLAPQTPWASVFSLVRQAGEASWRRGCLPWDARNRYQQDGCKKSSAND